MSVRERLQVGETILEEYPPFYLTSQRLLYYQQGPQGEVVHAIPLEWITGVEDVKHTHHALMVLGSLSVISGVVLLLSWGLITSVLAIGAGVVALFIGAMGRTAGYQVRARNVPKEEEALWRMRAWGSRHFVDRVRQTIGGRVGF